LLLEAKRRGQRAPQVHGCSRQAKLLRRRLLLTQGKNGAMLHVPKIYLCFSVPYFLFLGDADIE
jgi:hypothetical protein